MNEDIIFILEYLNIPYYLSSLDYWNAVVIESNTQHFNVSCSSWHTYHVKVPYNLLYLLEKKYNPSCGY